MAPRKLLAERVVLLESTLPADDRDLREIRRQINILDDLRARSEARRSKEVRRREERLAWRVIDQRSARAMRRIRVEEIAA